MNLDFKDRAVQFVREKNCATSVPVELIREAMEIGAAEALKNSTERIRKSLEELREMRARNLG